MHLTELEHRSYDAEHRCAVSCVLRAVCSWALCAQCALYCVLRCGSVVLCAQCAVCCATVLCCVVRCVLHIFGMSAVSLTRTVASHSRHTSPQHITARNAQRTSHRHSHDTLGHARTQDARMHNDQVDGCATSVPGTSVTRSSDARRCGS